MRVVRCHGRYKQAIRVAHSETRDPAIEMFPPRYTVGSTRRDFLNLAGSLGGRHAHAVLHDALARGYAGLRVEDDPDCSTEVAIVVAAFEDVQPLAGSPNSWASKNGVVPPSLLPLLHHAVALGSCDNVGLVTEIVLCTCAVLASKCTTMLQRAGRRSVTGGTRGSSPVALAQRPLSVWTCLPNSCWILTSRTRAPSSSCSPWAVARSTESRSICSMTLRRTSSSVGLPGQRFRSVRPDIVGMLPRAGEPSCSPSTIRRLAQVLRSSNSLSSWPCNWWFRGTLRSACLTSATTSMTSLRAPFMAAAAGDGSLDAVQGSFTNGCTVWVIGTWSY
jgi:hypothetical protein